MSRRYFDGTFGTKHNRLFAPGENYALNACVGANGGPVDFDRFSSGFFQAAAVLIEHLRQHPFEVDSLIYPIVQNSRHAIELSLKYLVGILSTIAEQNVEVAHTHKISDNWEKVQKLILHLDLAKEEDLQSVTDVLRDFIQLDPKGEAFRYPTSKHGDLYLKGTSHINVDIFADRISVAATFLSNFCFYADHLYDVYCEGKSAELDYIQDLEAAYMSEYGADLASLEGEYQSEMMNDGCGNY